MRFLYFLIFIISIQSAKAQLIISGTLVDVTKINAVEGAQVICTGGTSAVTDSMGRYKIAANLQDSVYFIYKGKPTQKFPVRSIIRLDQFDVALKIPVESRYTILKEVVVISKTPQQDSAENRDLYSKDFNFKKGVSTSVSPGGGAGLDLDELINLFRFRRNKRMKTFQNFLQEQEQDKYINFRFSKKTVQRITGLKEGAALDSFMVWYRPPYLFTATSTELQFNKYILNNLYQFRHIMPLEAKKEETKN